MSVADNKRSFSDFFSRHVGPSQQEVSAMLTEVGFGSLEQFIEEALPATIRADKELSLQDFPKPLEEYEALAWMKQIAEKNTVKRSLIGMGYSDCITPAVIQRNVLENPGWYTQYTPYQPEISQGRLEALLNYQTLVTDLTGLEVANSSLLDEGTAVAEAMALAFAVAKKNRLSARKIFLSSSCHPQTIEVVETRAKPLEIEVVVGKPGEISYGEEFFGAVVQYPGTEGEVVDYSEFFKEVHANKGLAIVACDLLSLMLLKSPGELGADIAVGNSQRFGVPFGFGGPHAAFFATRSEHQRLIPGRIVGVSKDRSGAPALRLALQTREQHIRRERATSNICTAQVLLAVMAGMYAVYHGPKRLKALAERVAGYAAAVGGALAASGYALSHDEYFDTITIEADDKLDSIIGELKKSAFNFRYYNDGRVGISFDEVTSDREIEEILELFSTPLRSEDAGSAIPAELLRKDEVLTHPVFSSYQSETEFLRYVRKLEGRDLSLGYSMIPLGSCTMKLNATTEMLPVSWPEFAKIHPFAPAEQYAGYRELFSALEQSLAEITGFDAVSLQPNAGSQGEYSGLLVIREFYRGNGEESRDICLIPKSAHGTNPASAVMAGMKVVVVDCDDQGNIDLKDLESKVSQHKDKLAALMVTYPSTHGVYEEAIKDICKLIHDNGGQVYMDGANLNALVGVVRPADLGADVSHINLHKTFCIPHGGGGPGVGPIAVGAHLAPYLPNHRGADVGHEKGISAVSAAPWGSALILPISMSYIAMMGADGLTEATEVAVLSANYIAKRLKDHYPILYTRENGFIAHECILDTRSFKKTAGIEVEDIAKRLMDYGFHAPTVSFPVAGTIMVEPTESESKAEIDRFCDAMIAIREEIAAIEDGKIDKEINPLKLAPHTAGDLVSEWERDYSKEAAFFPTPFVRENKFWPSVGRIDSSYGDKNLICSCLPIEEYES